MEGNILTLEGKVKSWKEIHRLISDAKKLRQDLRYKFLQSEVEPRLKEYREKYKARYNHLAEPKSI
jgi:hypothetical protein